MSNSITIVSPRTDKRFLIAKVCVHKSELEGKKGFFAKRNRPKIEILAGYNFYWSNEESFEQYFPLQEIANVGCLISSKELFDIIYKNSKFSDFVNLYWIKNGNFSIPVPWGIRKGSKGINGELRVEICKNSIEKFIKYYKPSSWEVRRHDGFIYEYLSDYYIGEDKKIYGLSVELQKKFSSVISSAIERVMELKMNTIVEAIDRGIMSENLQKIGLKYNGTSCNIVSIDG